MKGILVLVPRPGRARNLAALAVALASLSSEAAPEGRLELHTFARAFVPGELVRFEVVTDPQVPSLRGAFRGAELSFVRSAGPAGDAAWSAWGVIPLDASPGPAAYRLEAKRPGGSSLSATGDIAVSAKSFPEQRLTVASKFVNPPKSASSRIEREKKRLAGIYALRSALVPPTAPFVRPVAGDPTSEFGTHRYFNGEPRAPHPGIDLHAETGTPVVAAGPGRVVLAAELYYSGGTVIVDHGSGLFTVYGHLSKIEAKEGASVEAGDHLGLSGATGRVTGPHLHWGARVGESIFDPRALLDPRLFGRAPAPSPE